MNKHFYLLALVGLSSLGVNSAFGLTNPFASKKADVAAPQDNIERTKFWGTVVTSLKRNGYSDDSAEIRHAQRYLRRAENDKGKTGGFMSRMFGTGGKKATTARPARRTDSKVGDRRPARTTANRTAARATTANRTTARATTADRTKKTAAAKARAKRATTARTTARRAATKKAA
ncbi:hypothetical protein H0X48_03390 [Candidatus Dependentiae bacterium]|nr:hypothetical protein [Candidatus Dependentiae bacterium]